MPRPDISKLVRHGRRPWRLTPSGGRSYPSSLAVSPAFGGEGPSLQVGAAAFARGPRDAGIAQLVEHHLAKVGVAGSSPVSRSLTLLSSGGSAGCGLARPCRRRSQVVRQRSAKPPFGGSNPPGASCCRPCGANSVWTAPKAGDAPQVFACFPDCVLVALAWCCRPVQSWTPDVRRPRRRRAWPAAVASAVALESPSAWRAQAPASLRSSAWRAHPSPRASVSAERFWSRV